MVNNHIVRANIISGIRYLILSCLAVFFIYPFLFMILKSVDEMANFGFKLPPTLLPEKFGFNNYITTVRLIRVQRYYFNTIYITGWATIIHLITGVMAGYALSKGRFRFKKFWLLIILSTMMIPFESIVVARFLLFKDLGLVNTYTGLILPTLAYPFGIFLSKQYIDGLPDSLGEAAKIDGANEWLIYLRIYLPLTGPILATLAILTIMSEWNALLWPLVMLTKSSMFTISLGVAFFNQTETRPIVGNALALATLAIFPVVIMYLFLQRFVIQSVAVSGIKQ